MLLCFSLDHACNLRCSYCYTGEKFARSMSVATIERAIEYGLTRWDGSFELSFFGGEPLLHVDLMQHAKAYAERRLADVHPGAQLAVHVNTNGTIAHDEALEFLRSCACATTYVSLDGPASVHDRHRSNAKGGGSYVAVREGIDRIRATGASLVLLAVANPDSASELGAVAEELLSLRPARSKITCNLRLPWSADEISALRTGFKAAAVVWAQRFRAGERPLFEPFTSKILSHLHAATPHPKRCQLAGHEIVVAPSGRLYPCGELVGEDRDETHAVGDLATGLSSGKLSDMQQRKERVAEVCGGCDLRYRCVSYCGCRHVALTGELGRITPTLCEVELAATEAADSIAEELYESRCAAFLSMFYETQWRPEPGSQLVTLRRR